MAFVKALLICFVMVKLGSSARFSQQEKIEIFNEHNRLRAQLPMKDMDGKSPPKASNMMKLKWNKQLEEIAQLTADTCNFAHSQPVEATVYKEFIKAHTAGLGQNLYTGGTSYVEIVPRLFYSEIKHYRFSNWFCSPDWKACGHFTQMLDHASYIIGCARGTNCNELVVCNMYRPGNYPVDWSDPNSQCRPPYNVGAPCSECPPNTVCSNNMCELQGAAAEGEDIGNSGVTDPVTEVPGTTAPVTSAPGTETECKDHNNHCEGWANAGECQSNPSYMNPNCPKSCNRCTDSIATTPTPTEAEKPCKDHNENCDGWALVGECESNPSYMRPSCPKACKICKAATCEDDNPNCPGWANVGECESNPGYMLITCKKSCNRCS